MIECDAHRPLSQRNVVSRGALSWLGHAPDRHALAV